jgi:hypothetical protein
MDNGDTPAYPISEEMTDRIDSGITIYTGLTKREYFAGLAMQGWIACQSIDFRGDKEDAIRRAIEYADELLKQLDK